MSRVCLKSIAKTFGSNTVLQDLNLTIEDEEFFILLGPSGCGKTTTLNLICGLETPDYGEIFLDERNVTNLSPKERNVAMVFQDYALYPHLSVFENLAFPLKVPGYKINKMEIEERVKKVTQLLQIENLLNRLPKEISGGQRQRVSVGRALVRNPAVCCMDEPLSNLDARLRVQMRSELKRLYQEIKTTVIYVTHDQAEAMTLGTRVAIMNNGSIEQIDTPLGVYNHPNSIFTAKFLGDREINLLTGEIIFENNKFLFKDDSVSIMIENDELNKREEYSKNLIIGIRPEKIKVFFEKQNNSQEGEVILIEPTGSELYVHIKVVKDIFLARLTAETSCKQGDKVWVEFSPGDIKLFDAKTEKSLQ